MGNLIIHTRFLHAVGNAGRPSKSVADSAHVEAFSGQHPTTRAADVHVQILPKLPSRKKDPWSMLLIALLRIYPPVAASLRNMIKWDRFADSGFPGGVAKLQHGCHRGRGAGN